MLSYSANGPRFLLAFQRPWVSIDEKLEIDTLEEQTIKSDIIQRHPSLLRFFYVYPFSSLEVGLG
jgi:hypothetical protein